MMRERIMLHLLLLLLQLLLAHKIHAQIPSNGATRKTSLDVLLKLENDSSAAANGSFLGTAPGNSTFGDQNWVETMLPNETNGDDGWVGTISGNSSFGDQTWAETKFASPTKEEPNGTKKLHKRLTSEVTSRPQPMEASKVPPTNIVVEEGYPLEEHFATTADGYILTLHRLSGPRGSAPASVSSRKPVLLMHGLFLSSTSFLALGPGKSLGYLLAHAGYDVWLGNFRGNTYSRNHTTWNPDSDPAFWEFSQDEMAEHDVPAMVDYVLSITGARALSYVGFSQGGRAALMAATDRDLARKIDVMVVLASTGARTLRGAEATSSQLQGEAWRFLELVGKREIVSSSLELVQFLSKVCTGAEFLSKICTDALSAFSGRRIIRDDLYEFRQKILPVIFSHSFSGSSARQFSHQAQLADGVLRKFDLHKSGNLEHYGTPTPPEYDLSSVRCPVAIYWALNDQRTPLEDVKRISDQIPNVVKVHQIDSESFNHLDFMFAEKAKSLVYDDVIRLLDQYR